MRPTLLIALVPLIACKGGNDYSSMAKKANAARADAGSGVVKPAPAGATLLGSGQNAPGLLKLEGDSLFWLNEGGRPVGKPGVYRLPKAGGPVVALREASELLAIGVDATHVYWLAPRAGTVSKVPRGGGTVEVLTTNTGVVRGMVIDESHVYWAENEAIFRIPKAGGKAQTVTAAGLPDYLAVDATHVYWYSSMAGVVHRAPKKGGAASKVHTDDQHTLHTLFIDGADLFVSFGAENKMEIQRVSKGGGKAVTVIGGQTPANGFAIDAAHIYWITEDDIFKVPRGGGSATKVVEKLEHGRDLVVDDQFVYWVDRSGRVQKMPK